MSLKFGGLSGFWTLGQSFQFLPLLRVRLVLRLVQMVHLLLVRLLVQTVRFLLQGLAVLEALESIVLVAELAPKFVAEPSPSRETTRLISTPSLLSI